MLRDRQKSNELNPPIPNGVLANLPTVFSNYDLFMLQRRNTCAIPQIFYRTKDCTYSDIPQVGHTMEKGYTALKHHENGIGRQ